MDNTCNQSKTAGSKGLFSQVIDTRRISGAIENLHEVQEDHFEEVLVGPCTKSHLHEVQEDHVEKVLVVVIDYR